MKLKITTERIFALSGLLIVTAISYFGINKVNDIYYERGLKYGADIQAALDIQSYIKRSTGHLALHFMLHNSVDLDKFFRHLSSAKEQLNYLEESAQGITEKKTINLIREAISKIEKSGNALVILHEYNIVGIDTEQQREQREILTESVERATHGALLFATNEIVDISIQISSEVKKIESLLLLSHLEMREELAKEKYLKQIDFLYQLINHLTEEIYLNQVDEYKYIEEMEENFEILKNTGTELILISDTEKNFDPLNHSEPILKFYNASSAIRKAGIGLAQTRLLYAKSFTSEAQMLSDRLKFVILSISVLCALILLLLPILGSHRK